MDNPKAITYKDAPRAYSKIKDEIPVTPLMVRNNCIDNIKIIYHTVKINWQLIYMLPYRYPKVAYKLIYNYIINMKFFTILEGIKFIFVHLSFTLRIYYDFNQI